MVATAASETVTVPREVLERGVRMLGMAHEELTPDDLCRNGCIALNALLPGRDCADWNIQSVRKALGELLGADGEVQRG